MTTTTIPNLDTISAWLDETYNDYTTIYEYDEFIRFTHGSGGHYVDITIADDELRLVAHKDEQRTVTTCNPEKGNFLETMSRVF